MRPSYLTGVVLFGLMAAACADPRASSPAHGSFTAPPRTPTAASAEPTPAASGAAEAEPVVLMAAGDVADCSLAGVEWTAELVAGFPEATVAVLGDLAYPSATTERFDACYGPSWGQFMDRTRPAIGNHDLDADGAAPYHATFGDTAGTPGQGWYSYELGDWHIVVLNSNCDRIDCEEGSAQHQWLVADLANSDATCTLAYWHHPRFTSGPHGDDPRVGPFWSALADAGADLILSGHDHHYERFAPMTPDGSADPGGVRQFIVGTGGAVLRPSVREAPGSEVIIDDTWGVLWLSLEVDGYLWSFLTVDGRSADNGTGSCTDRPVP